MGLFSTTNNYSSRTEYVPYCKEVNINEHRAATDESVALLNEMQEKAQNNIIKVIKIDENTLKAIAIYYQDDMIQNRMIYHIRFILNGHEYYFKDHIDKFEWHKEISDKYFGTGNEVIFKAIHKAFSEVIALELMKLSPDFLNSIGRAI